MDFNISIPDIRDEFVSTPSFTCVWLLEEISQETLAYIINLYKFYEILVRSIWKANRDMRINCESHTGMGDEFHHYEIVHQVYTRDDRLVYVQN